MLYNFLIMLYNSFFLNLLLTPGKIINCNSNHLLFKILEKAKINAQKKT
jgi:hypothetical protein